MVFLRKKSRMVISISGQSVVLLSGKDGRIDHFKIGDIVWGAETDFRRTFLPLLPPKFRLTDEICLVLPREMFFSKSLRLPAVQGLELRKMAALQLSQHLPFPFESAVWDIMSTQQKEGATDVDVFAVQTEHVAKYLRLLSAVGCVPTHVTMSSSAVSAFISERVQGGAGVIWICEEGRSEICFCAAKGAPSGELARDFYYSRAFVSGLRELRAGSTDDFLTQLRLTFEAHRKYFPNIGVTTGRYFKEVIANVPQDLLEKIITVSGVDWREIDLPDDWAEKIPSQARGRSDVHVWSVMALQRKGFEHVLNFLPKDYAVRNTIRSMRRKMASLAVLVVGVIAAATLFFAAPVLKKWTILKQYDNELREIEGPFLRSRKEIELWGAINRATAERPSMLTFIEEIHASLPNGIALSRIRIRAKNELEIEGQALQSVDVNELQERMIKSPIFRDVRLERSVRRAGPAGELVHFAINARIRN